MIQKTPVTEYEQTELTPRRSNLGLVTKVIERNGGAKDTLTNHEVNVQLTNAEEELRNVPVHVQRMGEARVPAVGDFVEVSFLNGKSQSPFVSGFAYSAKQRAPLARSGHYRERFGDGPPYLFIEGEPRDHNGVNKDFDSASATNPANTIRMAVKKDGLSDPSARIELDLSTGAPVVRITRGKAEKNKTDMGIKLDFGTGEFKIGDGSGFGIESDGNGNFTWYEQSVDFVDDGSTIDWS